MLIGVLNEFGSEDKQSRQAQADAHAVDNSHVRKSISRADGRIDTGSQISPARWFVTRTQ